MFSITAREYSKEAVRRKDNSPVPTRHDKPYSQRWSYFIRGMMTAKC